MTVIFSIYRWSDFLNGPSLHLSSWSLREAPYNALNKHDEETPGLKVQTHRIILTELKFRSKVNYPTLLTEWKHHIAFDNITYEALNDLLLSFVVFMVKAFLATSSSKQFTCVAQQHKLSMTNVKHINLHDVSPTADQLHTLFSWILLIFKCTNVTLCWTCNSRQQKNHCGHKQRRFPFSAQHIEAHKAIILPV